MKKFKVTATKDVGYAAIISATNEEEAWKIAKGDTLYYQNDEVDWDQTDDGHDWTLENVRELSEEENFCLKYRTPYLKETTKEKVVSAAAEQKFEEMLSGFEGTIEDFADPEPTDNSTIPESTKEELKKDIKKDSDNLKDKMCLGDD